MTVIVLLSTQLITTPGPPSSVCRSGFFLTEACRPRLSLRTSAQVEIPTINLHGAFGTTALQNRRVQEYSSGPGCVMQALTSEGPTLSSTLFPISSGPNEHKDRK